MGCRSRCEECPLKDRSIAPGYGKRGGIAIVGEAPGEDEARKGRPFTGPSGKVLRDILRAVGVDPDEVYMTNSVICHPPKNKTPTKDMIDACRPSLLQELEEVRPTKILLVGGSSLSSLTPHLKGGNVASITKARGLGLMINLGGRDVYAVPSWHPAFIIRQEDLWRDLANDIYKLTTNDRPKEPWEVRVNIPRDIEQLRLSVRSIWERSILSCDLETTSLDPFEEDATIESIGFGFLHGGRPSSIIIPRELVYTDDCIKLMRVLMVQDRPLIFHNAKFDLQFLWKYFGEQLVPPQLIDTMLMTFRQDERSGGTHKTHSLKTQARVRYDIPDYAFDFEEFFATPVEERDYEKMYRYHAMDCEVTLQLYFDLEKELEEESPKFVPLTRSLDFPGCVALSRAEYHGVLLDDQKLRSLETKYTGIVDEKAEKLYEFMGRKGFQTKIEQLPTGGVKYSTLNSAPKMIEFFYDTLKVPGKVRTTEKEPLLLLSTQVKDTAVKGFIEDFLDYRLFTKAIDTFVRGLLKRMDKNGYIHPDFSQIGASTNRLSCRDPNVQNIPWLMGKDIRECFLAPEGWVWIDADESQLELRVSAFITQDEKMLAAYWDGRDLHREVAAIMFRKPAVEVTEYERYLAKYVDFGILYGRGAHAIATGWEGTYAEMKYGQKKWTVEEAQYFIDEFLGGFPQLHAWIKLQHKFVRENGYVETFLGHRRRFPYMTYKNVASIERQAVNSPIQGFASQITFSGLTRASNRFERELPKRAHILMTVHDSIGGIARPDVQDKYIEILRHEMTTPPVEMNVPLKADFKVGRSWGEAKGD